MKIETRKVGDLPSNSAGGGIDTLALLATEAASSSSSTLRRRSRSSSPSPSC